MEIYDIPGIEEIAIPTIEIHCNDDGFYFGRFKDGLDITIPRGSLSETRIKMLQITYDMLVSEKEIIPENSGKIEQGLEYIASELRKNNQTPEENKSDGEENK